MSSKNNEKVQHNSLYIYAPKLLYQSYYLIVVFLQ